MSTFIALSPVKTSVPKFVEAWRACYLDDDQRYFENINFSGTLSTANVVRLMEWKERKRFTTRAQAYGRAIPIDLLNDARGAAPLSAEDLLLQYEMICEHLHRKGLAKSGGIIWPLFLCHIGQPLSIPIYDVNVWRAWGYIEGWIEPKHYRQVPTTLDNYLQYRAWFNDLVEKHDIAPRELDQSLMAFGQFVRTRWSPFL